MSDANETRGEFPITLEGVAYTMRPSYEALVQMEQKTGCALSILRMAANAHALAIENAAIVVTEGIKAEGKATNNATLQQFSPERVGALLIDGGLEPVFDVIARMLDLALTGGVTELGEVKARAATI